MRRFKYRSWNEGLLGFEVRRFPAGRLFAKISFQKAAAFPWVQISYFLGRRFPAGRNRVFCRKKRRGLQQEILYPFIADRAEK
jgi:hypothetical protein